MGRWKGEEEENSMGKVSRGFSRRSRDTKTRNPIGAPGHLRSYSFCFAAGHTAGNDAVKKRTFDLFRRRRTIGLSKNILKY